MNRDETLKCIRIIEEFGLHHAIKDLPNSEYTVKAFEFAIDAMKAKLNCGCSYCQTQIYVKTTQYLRPLTAPLTIEQELRDTLVDLTGEVYVQIQKNFCPVCGRQLQQPQEKI